MLNQQIQGLALKTVWFILIGILSFSGNQAIAEEVHCQVKYFTKVVIYLNAGTIQGIEEGNRGEIRRGGITVNTFVVIHTADNSCSVHPDSVNVQINLGDEGVVFTQSALPIDTLPLIKPLAVIPQLPPVSEPTPRRRAQRVNHITGYVSLQGTMQDDLTEFNYDYQEPSLVVRTRMENIQGTHLTATIRLRARRTFRDRDGSTTKWENRFHDVSLLYDNPNSPWYGGVGRLIPASVSNAGYLDGLFGEYRFNDNITTGGFAGTEPDYTTSSIQPDQVKAGLYGVYKAGDYQTQWLNSSLALVGRYHGGTISSETVYEQVNVGLNNKWLFSQSANIELNRGWKQTTTGKSIQIANLHAMVRYTPLKWLSINGGYDNYTATRTFETRETPDSLFDESLWQGWHIGTDVDLPYDIHLYANGGLRSEEASYAKSGAVGAGTYNFIGSGMALSGNVNVYSNRLSNGWQPFLTVSRIFMNNLNATFQGGLSYNSIVGSETTVDQWVRFSGDYNLLWNAFISAGYELYRGDNLKTNRLLLDIGMRF